MSCRCDTGRASDEDKCPIHGLDAQAASVEKWEAAARGKQRLLRVLAECIESGKPASSGWLREKCGLSAEEWHGPGELVAAALFFCATHGFLEWHAKTIFKP